MDQKSEPTDLLGDPLKPLPDKRGRRKLRFPDEVYEKVEVLAACGMGQEDIADAVGISPPSLRKYFRPELGKAAARQRGAVLSALATQALKGNVSAAKAYLVELDKHAGAHAVRERERPSRTPAAAQPGKKVQRQEAAERAAEGGSIYAPPAAPQLVVNNSTR